MGALTYRERPCRSRAAEQRHELATLQWTGLHPLTLARHRGSIADWRASSQGLLRCKIPTSLTAASGKREAHCEHMFSALPLEGGHSSWQSGCLKRVISYRLLAARP